MWEIKSLKDSQRPEIFARTQLLKQHLPRFGYQYEVAVAEDLRREPRLQNAALLLRHGRQALTFENKEHARRLFASAGALLWADVVAGLYAPFTLQQACRMVLNGDLHLDIDQLLGGAALLTSTNHYQLTGAGNG